MKREKDLLCYGQFLSKANLYDQTKLVKSLLNGEKGEKLKHDIHNGAYYSLTISDEKSKVSITTPVLRFYITQWEEDMRLVNKKLSECQSPQESEKLKDRLKWLQTDRESMNKAPKRERTVYYWLLVPFWLGELLISYDEVVFRHFDCSWWGVSEMQQFPADQSTVLAEIYKDLRDELV